MDHKPTPQSKLSAINEDTFVRVSLCKALKADLRCAFHISNTNFIPAPAHLPQLGIKRLPQDLVRQQFDEAQTNCPLQVDNLCVLCQLDDISILQLQDHVYSKRWPYHQQQVQQTDLLDDVR